MKKTFNFHKEFQRPTGEKFIVSLDKQGLGVWLIVKDTGNKLMMTISQGGEIDIMAASEYPDSSLEIIEATLSQSGRYDRIKLQAHL